MAVTVRDPTLVPRAVICCTVRPSTWRASRLATAAVDSEATRTPKAVTWAVVPAMISRVSVVTWTLVLNLSMKFRMPNFSPSVHANNIADSP